MLGKSSEAKCNHGKILLQLRVTRTRRESSIRSSEIKSAAISIRSMLWVMETHPLLPGVTRPLDQMVPTDSEPDDANMRIILNRIDNYYNYNLEPLISEKEVDSAIKRVKNNKASGLDDFNPEIIKRLWRVDKEVVLISLTTASESRPFLSYGGKRS